MGMFKKQQKEEREETEQPLLLPPSSSSSSSSSSSQDHVGDRDSTLTPTFLLSILAVACGCFATGCTIGYTSPVEYQIIGELGLSVDEGAPQLYFGMLLIGMAAPINLYLAKTGKKKEFEAALLQLRGGNADISWEVDEIKVGNGLLVLQQFSGMNSYNMYTDVIFVSAGIPSTAGFLAVASFQIVGAFLAATMMDRYGRRPLLQIYEGAIAVWSGIPWMIVAEWNPPGASAVAIGFAVKLVPETRGKTLEEIQSSFTHKMGMTKKQEREETSCSNGEEGRTQAQQPLLLPPSQGHDGGGRDSPLTPTFLLSILAVACGSFSAGCTIGYTSPVEYQIIEELGLSVDEYSVFGSMMVVGGLMGSIVGGKITELIGRKRTMLGLDGLFIVGWLTIAFAEGALQLDLGMLLIGTGASINIYLPCSSFFPFMGEGPYVCCRDHTQQSKGSSGVSHSADDALQHFICIPCGFIDQLACLGYDRYQPSYKNCIEVFGIMVLVFLFPPFMLVNYFSGATPCFVQLLLAIFFIPESPRWLAKTGKEKEFEAALLQLRGGNVDISWEVDEIKEYTKIIHGISKNSSILDMFQKQYAIPLIVGNGLLLLQQFSGMNSYAMYTAAIFVSAGIPSTVGFLAVASFQLVATFMAAALMDRYGRRPLLQVGVIGTCLGSLLTALSFILQGFEGWSRVSPTLALLSVMIYSGSISIWSGIPWMIVAEIFPLNIKGSAGTMCCLSSSISGLMVSVSFQSLLRWSPLGTFLMYASVSAVAIGFVAKLVPETRGKTLEEIQSSFSRE
ncbi:unnamed protein product [Linum tenue]|uniref:Major facilitator superfamily (MFS) profile domain-containing protein n=1 Tax=Linum tenue TaxID=586396 RepID=A0AAV0JCG5_9ROSI|nr:unnamed protein product [Linum tenue]